MLDWAKFIAGLIRDFDLYILLRSGEESRAISPARGDYMGMTMMELTEAIRQHIDMEMDPEVAGGMACLLYTSPSPRDVEEYRMPSSA